jgi:excisionase family DNA binding protein
LRPVFDVEARTTTSPRCLGVEAGALDRSTTATKESAAMNLVGKSREQIAQATRQKKREELIDLIYSLATCEPMLTVNEVAARRGLSRDSIERLIKRGKIRAHKPLDKAVRVPLSSIRDWDQQTALFFKHEQNGNE